MKPSHVAITFLVVALSACANQEPMPPTITAGAAASISDVSVTSANPNTAPQDTTIDVHVLGSGFDRGSNAQWTQSGVNSPAVATNSTRYVSSGELVANITIAVSATVGSYDIVVTTSKGKKGIGSELFTISSRPVATVTVTPTSATMAVGSTLGLTASTLDVAKKVLTGRTVTWTTSDATVTAVTQAGLVTAVGLGSATITATSEGKSATSAITAVPIPSGSLVFSSLSTGGKHTCGLAAGGAAYCWGFNYDGELGNGLTTSSPDLATPLPGAVLGGLSFAALSPGSSATCGITMGGAAYCWGGNAYGLFGNGSQSNSLTPVPAASGLSLVALSVDGSDSCGLTTGGVPYCWGWNHYGQLGNGSTTDSSLPVAVTGGLTLTAINAGDWACGLTPSGVAHCWGFNREGELGAPTGSPCTMPLNHKIAVACSLTPVAVTGGLSFVTIGTRTGGDNTCGVTSAGVAYCWGGNTEGELGNGTTTSSSTPVAVVGGLVFAAVSTGTRFSCGVTVSGSAYCWGRNDHGQLGDGTTISRTTPVAVVGGLTFVAVGTGTRHSCGLTAGGTAYCWGQNSVGQLGNGTTADSYTPVRVAGQP